MVDPEQFEASRRALLQYYNSQTMTHGGYLIALLIGFLTLLSRYTSFTGNLLWFIFLPAVSALVGLSSYALSKTWYWGCLASEVLHVELIPRINENIIRQIQGKALENAKKHLWIARHFYRFRPDVIVAVSIIVFATLFFIKFLSDHVNIWLT